MTSVLAIVGPTASGKSEIALQLAVKAGADLFSVDSMQVYRGMDIGTAKPSRAQQALLRHHMIDVADPATDFSVAQFQAMARQELDRLVAERLPVVVAGGSGLHMRAVLDPFDFPASDVEVRAAVDSLPHASARAELLEADPGAGEAVDLDNPRRVQRALEIWRLTGLSPTDRAASPAANDVRRYRPYVDFVAVGFDPGPALEDRVRQRLDRMVEAGLLNEVDELLPGLGRNARQGVGYKQLIPVVEGSVSMEEGIEAALRATARLAKRQRTFFRRDPRIRWIEWDVDPQVRLERTEAVIEGDLTWTS